MRRLVFGLFVPIFWTAACATTSTTDTATAPPETVPPVVEVDTDTADIDLSASTTEIPIIADSMFEDRIVQPGAERPGTIIFAGDPLTPTNIPAELPGAVLNDDELDPELLEPNIPLNVEVTPGEIPFDPFQPVPIVEAGATSVRLFSNQDALWAQIAALEWPEPQTKYKDYPGPVKDDLKYRVYKDTGLDLYCRFDLAETEYGKAELADEKPSWEHVYPGSWIGHGFGFSSRKCNDPDGDPEQAKICGYANADMHNLFPLVRRVNSSRQNYPLQMLDGEEENRKFEHFCPDFENVNIDGTNRVEPTADARGDVARAITYMHFVYGLPIEPIVPSKDTLIEWMLEDPVDDEEYQKSYAKTVIQGTPNPLIAFSIPAGS